MSAEGRLPGVEVNARGCPQMRSVLIAKTTGKAMTTIKEGRATIARFGVRPTSLALVAACGLAFPSQALAQGMSPAAPDQRMMIQVEAQLSNSETVRLLIGLGRIKAELRLGMLFMSDGMTNPEGSHFSMPRKAVWPDIKDGLAAAGVPDLEPLLTKLEAGGGKDAVKAAFHDAESAILKAHGTLNPSGKDMASTVLGLAQLAAAEINASGPTEVAAYQTAWALLMAARGELDLLARNQEPGMAKLAVKETLAIDDVILSMPDPNQMAPVNFDPTPILQLIDRLKAVDEAA